ncbi:type II toxin-antitoxin system VapC family toxin [[Eubacterium] cellulosolvens]
MAVDRLRNNTIIILDSNALFLPFQFKLNLDSELTRLFGDYEIIIPSCVLSELQRLRSTEKFGMMALKLAKSKPQPDWYMNLEPEIVSAHELGDSYPGLNKTDSTIIIIAKAISGIVVTCDKILLQHLHEAGVQSVSLRGKKYLKLNSLYK